MTFNMVVNWRVCVNVGEGALFLLFKWSISDQSMFVGGKRLG